MTWQLYEVWGVDEAYHEELLETTSSKKEAYDLAEANLGLGYFQTIIYQEVDGELEEIHRFEQG